MEDELRTLESVSPLSNPVSLSQQPGVQEAKKKYIAKLQILQQQGYTLRDKIEDMQADYENKNDKLRIIVTPLSQIEEREVTVIEVKEVKRNELALLDGLK